MHIHAYQQNSVPKVLVRHGKKAKYNLQKYFWDKFISEM